MISVEQLAEYVGAQLPRDEARLEESLNVAVIVVAEALANAWRPVPEAVQDECVRRTAKNLFQSGDTADQGMFTSADGTGVPGVANDPLRKSWVLLKRYTNRV